ncbi:MAG: DUF6172 family protein [Verrucomicrobiales bacterium]
MKKTFPLENPPHKPPRVVEGIKHDVRKYLKRERRKALPEGVDFWDFNCRTGRDAESAIATHVEEITAAIDLAASENWPGIYIEILAAPGQRVAKKKGTPQAQPEAEA